MMDEGKQVIKDLLNNTYRFTELKKSINFFLIILQWDPLVRG